MWVLPGQASVCLDYYLAVIHHFQAGYSHRNVRVPVGPPARPTLDVEHRRAAEGSGFLWCPWGTCRASGPAPVGLKCTRKNADRRGGQEPRAEDLLTPESSSGQRKGRPLPPAGPDAQGWA